MIARHSSSVGIGTGQLVVPQISTKCRSSACRSDVLISLSGKPSKIGDASHGDCIESPHPFVGNSDGKGGAAPVNANTQPGQLLHEVWQIVRDGFARDGFAILGDAVGAVALFCMVGLGLFLVAGMGLQ